MSKKCIVGSIVHAVQFGALEIIENGAIIYNAKGIIESVLDLSNPEAVKEVDALDQSNVFRKTGKLIMPGFVDAHCHAPQYVFTGTGVDMDLMEWLDTYTFPVESRFKDIAFARYAYEKAVRRHLKFGTTFAAYYATLHEPAAVLLAEIISSIGQRAFVGKVAMDRNCPEFYIESTSDSVTNTESFVRKVLQQSPSGMEILSHVDAETTSGSYNCNEPFLSRRSLLNSVDAPLVLPCVTPRFVPTCTAESMMGLGVISHKYGLPVQSHLSESLNEIAFVKSLHPDATTYAGIYNDFKLLHWGSIMGHCIHCSEEELELLKSTNTSTVNCASSNFLLGTLTLYMINNIHVMWM